MYDESTVVGTAGLTIVLVNVNFYDSCPATFGSTAVTFRLYIGRDL